MGAGGGGSASRAQPDDARSALPVTVARPRNAVAAMPRWAFASAFTVSAVAVRSCRSAWRRRCPSRADAVTGGVAPEPRRILGAVAGAPACSPRTGLDRGQSGDRSCRRRPLVRRSRWCVRSSEGRWRSRAGLWTAARPVTCASRLAGRAQRAAHRPSAPAHSPDPARLRRRRSSISSGRRSHDCAGSRWRRLGECPAARRAHTGAGALLQCWARRPLCAHGPPRFQPARNSQVSADGSATSGAPADEYGST